MKMKYLSLISLAIIGIAGHQAHAQFASPNQFAYGKPTLNCVAQESQKRNIPLEVALAVNSVERGNTGQAVKNTNNTHDLGAFQINTIHLPMVQSKFGGTKQDLLNKGCFNAHVAMYLLHNAIHQPTKQHLDYYTRVAGYHSWTPSVNQRYRSKLVPYVNQWQVWLKQNNISS